MAAMAPALTDTAAHTDTFKLPSSPANPGLEGLFTLSSPDLTVPEQLKIAPVLSTTQTSLTDSIPSLDKIFLADVPVSDYRCNGKNGRNGHTHNHNFFHLENLTQLMKGRDTHSVIELLAGINGNRNKLGNSADLRFKMNGTDLEPSYKVNSTEIGYNVSLSEQVRSDQDNFEDVSFKNDNEEVNSNVSEIYITEDSKHSLITDENSFLGGDQEMLLDLDYPLHQDGESSPESDALEKEPFILDFEEKVQNTAESLLADISESCAPNASSFDETSSDLVDMSESVLDNVTQKQQVLEERSSKLIERLRKLQLSQLGLYTKDQIGLFTSYVERDHTSSPANECTACKLKQLQHNGHTEYTPCEKHGQPNSQMIKPAPHNNKAQQRIIQQGGGKEVFRKIDDVQRRLENSLHHLQNTMDSDATDSSSDEGDEESEFKMTYHEGPTRGYHRLSLNKRAIWKWAAHRAGIARRWTWLQAQVSDLEYRIRQHSDIYRQIKAAKGTVTLGTHPSTEEILRRQSISKRRLLQCDNKVATLEKSKAVSPAPLSSLLSNVDHQSARLHQSLSNCLSPPSSNIGCDKSPLQLNGCVHGRSSSDSTAISLLQNHRTSHGSKGIPDSIAISPEEQYCARTRPVRFYRKRRLVRPKDLYHFNPKAKRLSSVRCGCCPPSLCVMCGGRFNNLKPLNPDAMPVGEKVAYLDSGFHPVLSFPSDIPLPVRFESLLSKGESERRARTPKKRSKPLPCQLKGKKRNIKRLRKLRLKGKMVSVAMVGPPFLKKEISPQTRSEFIVQGADFRLFPRSKSDSGILLSNPVSEATTSEEELRRCRTEIKKKRAQLYLERKSRERSMSLPNITDRPPSVTSTPPDSTPPTPTAQLGCSLPVSTPQNKKKTVLGDAYDIDNIVIPYSMLASTRVEKLNYKEIDTPGWRMVVNGVMSDLTPHLEETGKTIAEEEDEEEYTSDSEYTHRHLKYEITEKKKFLAILANQGSAAASAGRRSRRTRNSSTNSTPDPLSPIGSISEHSLPANFDSPMSPSPLTTPDHTMNMNTPTITTESAVPRQLRSTSSEKRRISFGSDSQSSFDEGSIDNIHGWTMRAFPLMDEEVLEINASTEELVDEPFYTIRTRPSSSAVGVTHYESDDDSSGSDREIEDPNDPEWTVVARRKQPKTGSSAEEDALVLHLAVKKEIPLKPAEEN